MTTLEIETPATIFDMADMADAHTQIHWAIAKQMWSHGETHVLREDGKPICLFGIYPNDGWAEAWFSVRPECARHMGLIVRHGRLTLDAAPYPAIVTFCATDAGRRLARLCGFRFVEHWNNTELWQRDGRIIRREKRCGRSSQTAGEQPETPVGRSGAATG
ncbi:hypothetical protein [Martelella mangrovi]|uniref:GNAT family N-acetyltransferase n=1 Tax=Martelella mangrovi TaxID=1397477 RepID=A0ABV2IDR8_9HYPH